MDDAADQEKLEPEIEEEIEIELRETRTAETLYKERPSNLSWLGKKYRNTREIVYFEAETICDIWKHAMSVKNREVGGILVGKVYYDHDEYAIVYGSVPAKAATEKVASLTFTHDSWEHMLREMDVKFPGSVVVGWYHTHPGYGIFLSGMDMHIHNNFFKLPHQVALVIDPVSYQYGLFQWNNNRTELATGFPLYGNEAEIKKAAEIVGVKKQAPIRPHSIMVDSKKKQDIRQIRDLEELKKIYGDKIPQEIQEDIERLSIAYHDFTKLSQTVMGKLQNFLETQSDTEKKKKETGDETSSDEGSIDIKI